MNTAILIISYSFLAISIILFIQGTICYFKLLKEQSKVKLKEFDSPHFALIIPVIREQEVIGETLEHFSKINYPSDKVRVIVVTTEKENYERRNAIKQIFNHLDGASNPKTIANLVEKHPEVGNRQNVISILKSNSTEEEKRELIEKLPSTADIVDSAINRLERKIIKRIHYPYLNGIMAHQINHGVRYLFDCFDEGIDVNRFFVGVYNADSLPDLNTALYIAERISASNFKHYAFQQHSLYSTRGKTKGAFDQLITEGAALWQTRWSVCVEFPRALKSSWILDSRIWPPFFQKSLFIPYNYCIGHGFFIRLRELIEFNYFPENTSNEDAAFGYILSLAQVAVWPVPTFDNAEVPSSAKGVYLQQASWFNGPLHAASYWRIGEKMGLTQTSSKLSALLLMFKVFKDAIAWLVGPFLFILAAIHILLSGNTLIFTFSLGAIFYFVLPNIPVFMLQYRLKQRDKLKFSIQLFKGSFGIPLFYLIHGFAAIYSLIFNLSNYIGLTKEIKHKTER